MSSEEEDNISIKSEDPDKEEVVDTILNKNSGKKAFIPFINDQVKHIMLPGINKTKTWVRRRYTYEEIKEFISYIENDFFTVNGAARRAGIPEHAGSFYYRKYKADPNGEIPVPKPLDYHPIRRIQDVHTEFIAGLYKKDRGLKLREVHEALEKQFPDLKIKEISVARHIKTHMADIYKTTASYNGENNRKIFPQHSEFIASVIKAEPSLPVYKILNRLREKFPGFVVTESSLQSHIAKHLSEVYNASVDERKYHGRKIYPQHIEFVQELFEKNPNMIMEHVYKHMNKKFPYLKLRSSKGLADNLRKNHREFYDTCVKKTHYLNKRFTDEHSKFLINHHRKHPKTSLAGVHKVFLKAFPGITFKKDSINQHLKKKYDVHLLMHKK